MPPTAAKPPDRERDGGPRTLPPGVYDEGYFLSEAVEGFEGYRRGELSALRRKHLAMIAPAPGMDLLEIGFARGELLRACAAAGARVTGLDYSPAACAIARADGAARVVRGDCQSLPFADASFDRVFAGDVIEHQSQEGGVRLLAEMRRVLRPGGVLLVHTTPNRWFRRWMWPWLRHVAARMDAGAVAGMEAQFAVMDRVHLYEYSPAALNAAARQAGFPRTTRRVWVDPDLLRGGEHRLTRGLAQRWPVRMAGAIGGRPPLAWLLGNDLYLWCKR
jgi:ubiquinone/menaquinone biosynthesis C-methylase UbiE